MKRFKESSDTYVWTTLPDRLIVEPVLIFYKSEAREEKSDAFIWRGNYYTIRFCSTILPEYAGSQAGVCLLKPLSKVKYFKKVARHDEDV